MISRPSLKRPGLARNVSAVLAIVGSLSACSSLQGPAPRQAAAPIVDRPAPSTPATPPGVAGPASAIPGTVVRGKAQWVPAQWADLPGWDADRVQDWWPALFKGCVKPANGWSAVCAEVRKLGPDWGQRVENDFVRQWVQSHLQPWRVVSLEGSPTGLMTGYFEPLLEARRTPDARYQFPLHRAPADLGSRKPYLSRTELEATPEGRAAMAGRELVYLADPLDVLLVQVQGSGRVRVLDELNAQGVPKVVRLAFNGHNDQPYQSVARWLVDQGAFTLDQASWPAIRNWATQNPARVSDMMRANPRVVFFREEPLADPQAGPNGAQGVPLTPGRSIAVDRDSIPLGTPVWLVSTPPSSALNAALGPQVLQRLVMAQDTGGAILGAVRADYFWGWGDEALAQAGRTKQPLAMWALWPQGRVQ
jgi:membrane-bound lytic murein transglycosylase A